MGNTVDAELDVRVLVMQSALDPSEDGRQCEGPQEQRFHFVEATAPRHYKNAHSLLHLPSPPIKCTRDAEESRAFEYFLACAGPILSGTLETQFWTRLVPQFCMSDLGVWDAVLAVSVLFEHPVSEGHPRPRGGRSEILNSHHRRALGWYHRSLTQARQRTQHTVENNTSALLSCLLFTSIEFQQGNVTNALRLVDTSFKLMATIGPLANEMQNQPLESEFDGIVASFLRRHAVVLETMVRGLPAEWYDNISVYLHQSSLPTLTSFNEARLQLCTLRYQAYEVLRTTSLFLLEPEVHARQRAYQQSTIHQLQKWLREFEALLEADDSLDTMVKSWKASNLLMHYRVTYIWLSACLDPFQMDFDIYDDEFNLVVDHAETVLDLCQQDSLPKSGVLDTGVILSLYFVVWRCRHPNIRRRALTAMRKCPVYEHTWIGIPSADVAEKIITIEESAEIARDATTPQSIPRPSKRDRICHIIYQRNRSSRTPEVNFWKIVADDTGTERLQDYILEL